jgi:hypothetical protein
MCILLKLEINELESNNIRQYVCSYIPAAAAYAVYTSHLSDIPEHGAEL